MNIGLISCLIMGGLFLIVASIFALLKEKGAILISGFNSLSKKEREKYNQKKISQDMRNSLFLWRLVFLIGAVLCYFISQYTAIVAFIVWIILFFRDVHFDTEKAFAKYRL